MSRNNWQFYIMEALAIAGFILSAAFTTIFLNHPDSPVAHTMLAVHPLLKSIILGLVMGIYITSIALAIGKQSGAHANPMMTWAFFRIRKIKTANIWAYFAAQFLGAIAAVLLLHFTFDKIFEHPLIDDSLTKPKPGHSLGNAFIAEFIISFIFVMVNLLVLSSKKLEKYNAVIAGLMIALFLIIELPYSGMSMNPARSFASALVAWKWEEIWVYFVAPAIGMLLATELFLLWQKTLGVDQEGQPKLTTNLFGSLAIPVLPSEES